MQVINVLHPGRPNVSKAELKEKLARLYENGLDTKVEKSRKQLKERKNGAKKIRGVKKVLFFVLLNLKLLVDFTFLKLVMFSVP
ncbi:hypothetical protein DVH24_017575 [Malus domestica]|uniref:Uncharacterized protein n=1 Tax=Malus domestica TaxID=3750 RepID=A0A498KJF9_MALDO|nr:hypothetical protein DVH24_017575 [Malus domestica]